MRFIRHTDEDAEIPDEAVKELQGHLVFQHQGADGEEYRPAIGDESQGTQTWIATVGPTLDALRLGQVLVVNELDSSLHPTLTADPVDFPSTRKGMNKQRRYPAGAFSAITRVDASSLRRYLSTSAEEK